MIPSRSARPNFSRNDVMVPASLGYPPAGERFDLHPAVRFVRIKGRRFLESPSKRENAMKIAASVAAIMLAVAVCAPAVAQQPTPSSPSLYKRLGGYDAMAAVTDDFLRRLTSDPSFARFFSGHSTDSLKKIRQLIVDQLCAATGGPCIYIGRDMKTAHAGLDISEKDWDTSVKYLTATLDELNVPAKEKSEVLAAISGLEKDIVEKP